MFQPDNRLKHTPVPPELVEAISTNAVSEDFVHGLIEIMRQLTEQLEPTIAQSAVIIDIPRGGTIPSKVIASKDGFEGVPIVIANTGSNRDPSRPMFADILPLAESYILPDGIMATGGTIKSVITAILEQLPPGSKPKFKLVNPIVSAIGLDLEPNIFEWADQLGIDIEVVTAHIEPTGGYVRFGEKEVLVVGPIELGEDGQLIRAQIGDYGEMTTQAEAEGLVPAEFTLPFISSLANEDDMV